MQTAIIDFETWPIFQRPHYPPKPVGVAIHLLGQSLPHYYAWGHVGEQRPEVEAQARTVITMLWNNPNVELVFHNAKFDLEVAMAAWGLPMPDWRRVHDTMLLAFLCDPHGPAGLKPLAESWLGMPPEERDAVADWVQANKAGLMAQWSAHLFGLKVQKGKEGAWMFQVPSRIAGPYAEGDVIRTGKLYTEFRRLVEENGMAEAYDRERRVLPIFLRNEQEGLRVDTEALGRDVELYGRAFDHAERWLRTQLHASGLNFDSDQDVAAILVERGIVPVESFSLTKPTRAHPNGQLSMSKDNLLPELFTGPLGASVASALGYRNRLKTCLDMFMRPWLAQAEINGGRITTQWNQVRGYNGGARTGRPSTNDHNLLNISKDFSGRDDQYQHPLWLGVPELPLCRTYVLPDEGHVMVHRDFSGQELRVFGHFEQGALWQQYQEDPDLDVHAFVGGEFMRVAARDIERTKVKVMNFQSIYGGGIPALQAKIRCTVAEARELKAFHDQALPGRKILAEEIKRVTESWGEPIRTWGGRLYYPEKPGPDGRSKGYKLLNYLVQGSAADITKQAMIDWDDANSSLNRHQQARFMIQVYDELNLSAPMGLEHQHMAMLREVMERPRLTVPMRSDGKMGPAWGRLKKYNDELRAAA